jgi:hypothetical protein
VGDLGDDRVDVHKARSEPAAGRRVRSALYALSSVVVCEFDRRAARTNRVSRYRQGRIAATGVGTLWCLAAVQSVAVGPAGASRAHRGGTADVAAMPVAGAATPVRPNTQIQ